MFYVWVVFLIGFLDQIPAQRENVLISFLVSFWYHEKSKNYPTIMIFGIIFAIIFGITLAIIFLSRPFCRAGRFPSIAPHRHTRAVCTWNTQLVSFWEKSIKLYFLDRLFVCITDNRYIGRKRYMENRNYSSVRSHIYRAWVLYFEPCRGSPDWSPGRPARLAVECPPFLLTSALAATKWWHPLQ